MPRTSTTTRKRPGPKLRDWIFLEPLALPPATPGLHAVWQRETMKQIGSGPQRHGPVLVELTLGHCPSAPRTAETAELIAQILDVLTLGGAIDGPAFVVSLSARWNAGVAPAMCIIRIRGTHAASSRSSLPRTIPASAMERFHAA